MRPVGALQLRRYACVEQFVEPGGQLGGVQREVKAERHEVEPAIAASRAVPIDDAADGTRVDQHISRMEVEMHQIVSVRRIAVGADISHPGQHARRATVIASQRFMQAKPRAVGTQKQRRHR